MQVVKQGGLSGKARRTHKRNRAVRLHASQLIAEYFEPGLDEVGRERRIPVRGRNEFLPSITPAAEAASSNFQRELPLTRQRQGDLGHRFETGATPDATKRVAPQRATAPAADVAVRFPRTRRSALSLALKPPEQFKRKGDFTIAGFLFGCVMGSAAAALVLLLVHTVTG